MRYLGFVIMSPDQGPPPQELMDAMDAYVAKNIADGVFLDGGGLGQDGDRAGYQLRAGQLTATDGPFTEAKEIIGGYSVLEFRSHAEAVEAARQLLELHRQHWPGWEGRVEVHRIFGGPDQEPDAAS